MSALWDKCRSMRGVMPSGPGDDRGLRVFSFCLSSYTFVFCKGGRWTTVFCKYECTRHLRVIYVGGPYKVRDLLRLVAYEPNI